MSKYFLLLVFCATSILLSAQSSPCASNAVYRQFDFWLGDWTVENKDGKPAGTSRVELLLDSCVLLENWENNNGAFSGKSFNVFNRQQNQWQQTWVDNKGNKTEYAGGLVNGKMVLDTKPEKRSADTIAVNRMTFNLQEDGRVRQLGEFSADGGKTWNTQFDLYYKRTIAKPKN